MDVIISMIMLQSLFLLHLLGNTTGSNPTTGEQTSLQMDSKKQHESQQQPFYYGVKMITTNLQKQPTSLQRPSFMFQVWPL